MKTTNDVAIGHGITLNNDNAKKFATRLKKTLKEENIDFKTSKCYDILAKTFGSSNWHELSQHLNSASIQAPTTERALLSQNSQTNSTMNSIFDLPWIEFKYIISKMTDQLGFDFHTKEFLDILLDIVHTNQPKSEIYWEKINEFLDSGDKYFRNIEGVPIYNYTAYLNPSLNGQEVESFINRVIKCSGRDFDYRPKFKPEHIESFFYMLRFLKEENFILRDKHTAFSTNNILQYERDEYKSDHEFISILIHLADINNNSVRYSRNTFKTLSFHDLIIQLYSRTNMLNHISQDSDKLLQKYTKYIAEELFKNYNFIAYLCSHLKSYVHNNIIFKKNEDSLENEYVIEYYLNYTPHGLILKHEIENWDIDFLTNTLHTKIKSENSDNPINIRIQFNLNKNSPVIHSKTINYLNDYLHEKLTNRNNLYFSFEYKLIK